jgi:hypothetical protein
MPLDQTPECASWPELIDQMALVIEPIRLKGQWLAFDLPDNPASRNSLN